MRRHVARARAARPLPPLDHEAILWSRTGVGDMLEGLMTPLALSFVRHYRDEVHAGCLAAVGVRDPGEPAHYYRFVDGRVYANVSYLAHLLAQTPVGRDRVAILRGFTSGAVPLDGPDPYGGPGPSIPLASWGHWLASQATMAARASRTAERMAGERRREVDRFRSLALSSLPLRAIGAEIERTLAWFRSAYCDYMPLFFTAYLLGRAIAAAGERWGDADAIRAALAASMSVNAESARLCADLARRARRARVDDLIANSDAAQAAGALAATRAGRRFLSTELGPFLREHGVRGQREMELTAPRWLDRPALVLERVQTALRDDEPRSHGTALRGLAASGPQRAILTGALSLQRRWARHRSRARPTVLAAIWQLRGLVYEVGRRLERDGTIASPAEVAYLDLDEVRAIAAGRLPARAGLPRREIEARRRQHEANQRTSVPAETFAGAGRAAPTTFAAAAP